jgi:NADH:ubiquinone reductase (H+-translocating)
LIGDTASLDQDGKPLPGVPQVAMQQRRYVGKLISRRVASKNTPKPFRYFDKGNMAVVGKGVAVLQSGKLRMAGLVAWLAWVAIHIAFLSQIGLRISVFLQWIWTFLTGQRGSRLIVNHHGFESTQPARPITADGSRAYQAPIVTTAASK